MNGERGKCYKLKIPLHYSNFVPWYPLTLVSVHCTVNRNSKQVSSHKHLQVDLTFNSSTAKGEFDQTRRFSIPDLSNETNRCDHSNESS